MDQALCYYDPVCQWINISKEIIQLSPRFTVFGRDPRPIFKEILKSYEMSRLMFLKQAGLNFLVFPSASHTRFCHSLGCWLLGKQALDEVKVRQATESRPLSLKEWLSPDRRGFLFEFLLALLVHDCGHMPFSHVLENNPDIKYNHEEIVRQMILGEGEVIERIKQERGDLKLISEILKKHKIDEKFIVGLVCSSREKFTQDYEEFLCLKDLVDSRIDLDRIDHYLRDSMYMGVNLANFNTHALLENITLFPNSTHPTRVKEEGIPHLMSLLFSRELIWKTALDRMDVRSYEVLLNCAVSMTIKEKEIDPLELSLLTEDELIYKLRHSENRQARTLMHRLFKRDPYVLIDSIQFDKGITRKKIQESVDKIIQEARIRSTDLLFYAPFNYTIKNPDLWLNLHTEDGKKSLKVIDPGFYDFLLTKDMARRTQVRFFASSDRVKNSVEKYLKREFY